MKLRRGETLVFEREDGSTLRVPPITRGQMRSILALDPHPAEEESIDTRASKRAEQIRIFLQRAEAVAADGSKLDLTRVIDDLTADEEIDIIIAIMASHIGHNPNDAVSLQQALRELVKKKIGGRLQRHKTPS